jgi:hypothetical protein
VRDGRRESERGSIAHREHRERLFWQRCLAACSCTTPAPTQPVQACAPGRLARPDPAHRVEEEEEEAAAAAEEAAEEARTTAHKAHAGSRT